MKRGHVYTFAFMVVVTAVLVFALAAAYEAFKPAIQINQDLGEQRAVLYALGLDDGLKDDQVSALYREKVQPAKLDDQEESAGKPILAHVEQGQPLAYALPFEGSALWGGLRGYLGITADKTEIKGLVFTYQNETPGLGGRIDEEAYKEQFRGIAIAPGTTLKYGPGPDEPDAVTGATQTSQAVLRTLNKLLTTTIFQEEGE